MMTQKRIIARGPVERMSPTQFNVLEYDVERYLAEFHDAGCETVPEWDGKKPLKVTISSGEWVSQLNPGDVVEYELEPVERNDKKAPRGRKVGTRGVAMRILSRADQGG